MSLIDKINADRLDARKAKDTVKATLLTTLVGEAEMVGKNKDNRPSTDEEVIAVIKKFIKNAEETAERWNHRNFESQGKRQVFLKEIEILSVYLPEEPVLMTEDELKNALIEGFRGREVNKKLMGEMMKFLSLSFPGKFDGKVASSVASKLINSGAAKI